MISIRKGRVISNMHKFSMHIKKYSMMFLIDFHGRKSFLMSLKSFPYFSMASSKRFASALDQSSSSSLQRTGPEVGTKLDKAASML